MRFGPTLWFSTGSYFTVNNTISLNLQPDNDIFNCLFLIWLPSAVACDLYESCLVLRKFSSCFSFEECSPIAMVNEIGNHARLHNMDNTCLFKISRGSKQMCLVKIYLPRRYAISILLIQRILISYPCRINGRRQIQTITRWKCGYGWACFRW